MAKEQGYQPTLAPRFYERLQRAYKVGAPMAFGSDVLLTRREKGRGAFAQAPANPEVSARVERAIRAHEGTTWRVAFSPDGRRLATGGDDAEIRLWYLEAPPR